MAAARSPPVPTYERVWEQQARPWQPRVTYTLLGLFVVIYILEWITLRYDPRMFGYIFLIAPDFLLRPWSLITSTVSHAPNTATGDVYLMHLLFNGLFLYFFGPILERIWGAKKFAIWFFVAGALSGALQVLITGGAALGASGALMLIFGVLAVIMPTQKIHIWGILPVPLWGAAVGYAALDVFGVFHGFSNIGHFAHLSGMALGLYLGWRTREELSRRGIRYG
jgi:uncharacterized protein